MNKKFFYSTTFCVYLYVILYIILTVVYCLPRLLAEFSHVNVSRMTETFTFPLEIFAWGLVIICSAYCGIDRASMAVKTSMMEMGSCDIGNVANLRRVIVILFLIFIENLVLNLFLGHPFTVVSGTGKQVFNGIELPMEGITSALVSTLVIYVAGNKAIQFTQNVDKTKKGQKHADDCEEIVLGGDK